VSSEEGMRGRWVHCMRMGSGSSCEKVEREVREKEKKKERGRAEEKERTMTKW
jgi:hypothetical protein